MVCYISSCRRLKSQVARVCASDEMEKVSREGKSCQLSAVNEFNIALRQPHSEVEPSRKNHVNGTERFGPSPFTNTSATNHSCLSRNHAFDASPDSFLASKRLPYISAKYEVRRSIHDYPRSASIRQQGRILKHDAHLSRQQLSRLRIALDHQPEGEHKIARARDEQPQAQVAPTRTNDGLPSRANPPSHTPRRINPAHNDTNTNTNAITVAVAAPNTSHPARSHTPPRGAPLRTPHIALRRRHIQATA